MPHAVIEYPSSLRPRAEAAGLLQAVHGVMLQSGLFTAGDIKTRVYETAQWVVGEAAAGEGEFVHLTVSLLAGRTVEQRQALSNAMHAVLLEKLPATMQLTVNIHEMDRDTYKKRVA